MALGLQAVGLDACKAGWVFAGWTGQSWELGLVGRLSDLQPRLLARSTILVDMPIGLSADGRRACDRLARQRLGARASSVFPVPARLVLAEQAYEMANAAMKQRCGRGLSKQAFYLLPKIRELESYLTEHPKPRGRWYECHPELCFCQFNQGRPMRFAKKTREGQRERLELIRDVLPEAVEDNVSALMASTTRRQLALDDVLDALALASLAATPRRSWIKLPSDPAPRDDAGLPMQIIAPASDCAGAA